MQDVTVFYPDSSLCTLRIEDRNDSICSVSMFPCRTLFEGLISDSESRLPWPGTKKFLSTGYGTKLLFLSYPVNTMGNFSGHLLIRDDEGAADSIPFAINKVFLDPFSRPPLSGHYWKIYNRNDPEQIRFDDEKLLFLFKADSALSAHPLYTGFHSVFHLPDSFMISVEFKLRDEMTDSFSIAFFVSSSPDTDEWSGKKAGIFLSGADGKIHIECRSINFQSFGFDKTIASGKLGIHRNDSISYLLNENDSVRISRGDITHYFPPHCPVFVHITMRVNNQRKERHCYWKNFQLTMGALAF
jgi:hypothetical protein